MMSPTVLLSAPPVSALIPERASFSETVIFQLNGLVVVLSALGMIWLMLELIGLYFRRRSGKVGVAVADPRTVEPANELPPELIAAIAAAVHLTLGGGQKITSIVPTAAPTQDWAREGRRQIHSARRVR